MRPVRVPVWGCALAALLAGGTTARAAWDNVFQVCCHKCRSAPAPVAAYYAAPAPAVAAYADPCCPAPCPAPCPQTTCTTPYVQRCYYQPVTTCRTTTPGAPVCAPPAGAAVVPPTNGYAAPPSNGYAAPPGNGYAAPPSTPPPGVSEERTPAPPPPGVGESRDPGLPSS